MKNKGTVQFKKRLETGIYSVVLPRFFTGYLIDIFSKDSKNKNTSNYRQNKPNPNSGILGQLKKIFHLGFAPFNFLSKEMKDKNKHNNGKSYEYASPVDNLIQLIQSHDAFLSRNTPRYKQIIDNKNRNVNSAKEPEISIVKNNPAAISVQNAEYTRSASFEIISLIDHTVSKVKYSVNRDVN